MAKPRTPAISRFWGLTERVGGCIIWRGSRIGTDRRYGGFRPHGDEKNFYAHRWIFEYTFGPIPEGLEIDHVRARGCTGGLCVNPDHLEAVTPTENRTRARWSQCLAGHDLSDPANQTWDDKGRRRGCVQCKLEYGRDYQRRLREAGLKPKYQRQRDCVCKNGRCGECRKVTLAVQL